jgi:hypothetical protein
VPPPQPPEDENAHAILPSTFIHAVVFIDHDTDRSESVLRFSELVSAEATRLGALITPGQKRLALGGQLLDASEHSLRGVEAAFAVYSGPRKLDHQLSYSGGP